MRLSKGALVWCESKKKYGIFIKYVVKPIRVLESGNVIATPWKSAALVNFEDAKDFNIAENLAVEIPLKELKAL